MKEWVVITGAASDIGRAITIHFAHLDFNVMAIDHDEMALRDTKLFSRRPENITPVLVDLRKSTEIDIVVSRLSSTDKINYLIHCATTCEPLLPLLNTTENQRLESLMVNVLAPISLTQKLKSFFNFKTRVLFFGSDYVGTMNKIRENFTGSYGMAQSALETAVAYLKRENHNLLIGYVNPSETNSKMHRSIIAATGFFNHATQPAEPVAIAIFIAKILTTTPDHLFKSENWHFRNREQHHFLSLFDESQKAKIQSTL